MEFTQGIRIDGILYDVPLVSIKRAADVLDKYAERTEDGDLKRELIGVYFNYQMSFGTIDDDNTYDALWDKLTEPVEYHDFTLPTTKGTYSFRGYISGVSDEIEKVLADTVKFKGLQCKFTAKMPARVPGG
ncbi:MAG: hypothetical protein IJ335_01230 [Lachnospiraceae bacterium]|nr:hypothetical protein [Lachnospiraceae bacterium]